MSQLNKSMLKFGEINILNTRTKRIAIIEVAAHQSISKSF